MLALSLIALSLPALWVRFAPIVDLPQQLAQIRLFSELAAQTDSSYVVVWFGPNHLSHLILGAALWLGGPEHAAR